MLRTETDLPFYAAYPLPMAKSKPPTQSARPGQFIRAWRKRAGLTQEGLAVLMGIARSYVSHVENGKRRYDQLFLEGAAPHLKCEPRDLLRPPTIEDEVKGLIGDLSPAAQKRVLTVVKAMKESETP